MIAIQHKWNSDCSDCSHISCFPVRVLLLKFSYVFLQVNGPLEAVARDLGFAGNAALQGAVSPYCHSPCSCIPAHYHHLLLPSLLDRECPLLTWLNADSSRLSRWSAVSWLELRVAPSLAAVLLTDWDGA